MAMIASKKEAGDIEVRVTSKGLPEKKIALRALSARCEEGVCCDYEVPKSEPREDVSVRKIELSAPVRLITPETGAVRVGIKIYPENNTYGPGNIGIKAVTESGVETNLLEIESDGKEALLKPRGDGIYRLRAYCKNGGRLEETVSELEFENRGFGSASIDPYGETVCASLCTNADENQSTMGGGVIVRNGSVVRFDSVNFGKIGSDEITIGIYTYNEQKIPVELLDGGGNVITTLEFQSKTEWNTYKYNTFRLPEKLRGERGIAFKFGEELRFKGFMFSAPRRLGEELLAVENDGIYGDSFTVGADAIERIGNNVSVIFEGINLGDGAGAVEITCRTRNEKDTVHLRFDGEDAKIIEVPRSDGYVTRRFGIGKIAGTRTLKVVFLPGCDFDFKSIKFVK